MIEEVVESMMEGLCDQEHASFQYRIQVTRLTSDVLNNPPK